MKIHRAYCDGVSDRQKGMAAYSFIIVEDFVVRHEKTETFASKSPNEAEMRAVLMSLDAIKAMGGNREDRMIIYTNLKTIPDAFDKGWIQKWMNNGWHNSDGNEVRHKELWWALWEYHQRWSCEIRHAEKDDFAYFARLKKRVRKAVKLT